MKRNGLRRLAMLVAVVALLVAAACAAPTQSAQATLDENTAAPVTIGIAQFAEHASLDNCREGFLLGLEEEGFIEGENLTVEYQNAAADMAATNQVAQSLVADRLDMICAIATPMAQAAYNAADGQDIPVIYSAVTDPVMAELANEDGTSDGNTTGTSDLLPVAEQLQLIRAYLPDAKKIGILYSTSEVNSVSAIEEYKAIAGEYGFEIVEGGVTTSADIPLVLDNLLAQVDCLSNLTDNTVVSALATVLEQTNEAGIPVFGSEIEQVKNGCVAAAGLDYIELGKQTGRLAARVLRGEAAGSIPFEVISEYGYYINSAALSALGLETPAEIADRVQEVTA